MRKCLLVMAGGTGGHIFPGLAVADELASQGWDIQWLGTAARMEAQIVPKAGFPIHFIDVAGVRGNGLMRLLAAPFKIAKAVIAAGKVMKQVQPDVVLGMGGFASGPGGIAARLQGKPLVLHEQNAIPGLTNRILARFANRVFSGFDRTFGDKQDSNPQKYQWVGNPVRDDISHLSRSRELSTPLRILVVGGSLGARVLNQTLPAVFAAMPDITVRHQCGKGNVDSVEQDYQQQVGEAIQWQVNEFIDDMAAAYSWADLIICRAGALTVAEVASAGLAAIFVPLPHAVDDHQTRNAANLADSGAAILLPQPKLEQGELQPLLTELLNHPEQLTLMGDKARALAKPDAAQQVAQACINLAGEAA